jgi:hypothetical protein
MRSVRAVLCSRIDPLDPGQGAQREKCQQAIHVIGWAVVQRQLQGRRRWRTAASGAHLRGREAVVGLERGVEGAHAGKAAQMRDFGYR